jgi:hypothetical protein
VTSIRSSVSSRSVFPDVFGVPCVPVVSLAAVDVVSVVVFTPVYIPGVLLWLEFPFCHAGPATVDYPSATGIPNECGVPALVGVRAFVGSLLLLAFGNSKSRIASNSRNVRNSRNASNSRDCSYGSTKALPNVPMFT